MATTNDITNDRMVSKHNTDAYRSNYEAVFGKKKDKPDEKKEDKK